MAHFPGSLAAALVTMLVAIGCPAAPTGQPILTDPGEILMAGVRSTAALQYVHVRVDGEIQERPFDGVNEQVLQGVALDFDIDVAQRSIAGRTIAKGTGGPDQVTEVILVNGGQFIRMGPNTRWTQFPNTNGPLQLPTTDQIIGTVSPLVGSGIVVHPAEPVACGEGTCYHVVADLDADTAMWIIGPVFLSSVPSGQPDPGLGVQPITLDLYVDQATRSLFGANGIFTFRGATIAIRLTLTNHDVPLRIVPPPPALVDQLGDNVGGGEAPQTPH